MFKKEDEDMQYIYVDTKKDNNLNDYNDDLSIEEMKEFIDPLFKPYATIF